MRKNPSVTAQQAETRLKQLGFDCHNGFWLDTSTFLSADKAKTKVMERKVMSPLGGIEKATVVIFTNAVEILVDEDDKIVGVTMHSKLAVWGDAISRALREIEKNTKAAT